MQIDIEFFWDPGSTNTYFAWKLLPAIAARHDARIVPRAFNLGYVFRHHNYAVMAEPPPKIENRKRDLARWAEKYALPFRFPGVFPIKTSVALRGAIAMRRWDRERDFINAVLEAYWERDDHSIAEIGGLKPLAASLGVDPEAFAEAAESDEMRQALIDETQDALDRGVFGAPSMLLGNELFWGKDRMDFVEDELERNSI
ncbi:MAG: 2-hydroxychromene-2-carboxylate isomerase [Minwuia sp.]|uniref:2-hydroxychromene-2-carboxylate isomerase n=1 Tax=Minwuia sp. TaxID=2493630 RepID=UPI003A876A8E